MIDPRRVLDVLEREYARRQPRRGYVKTRYTEGWLDALDWMMKQLRRYLP